MKAIDVWMQHPNEIFLGSPIFDSLRRWIPDIPRGGHSIETTLSQMDAGNVEKGLISAWYGPMGALISNDEVYECTQKYPDRLFGLAGVDIRNPVKAVHELRKCVHEYGFKGLRLIQWLWEKPVTDALYYPLLSECVQLRIPICLQVGMTGPLRTSMTGRPLSIEQIALDFPDLKIVCGHIGYPWQQEMIAIATKFPNVYIDTSAYKCKRYPPEIVTYMKTNGVNKVLFGSNYPMIMPKDCLEGIELLSLGLSLAPFLRQNAQTVFGI